MESEPLLCSRVGLIVLAAGSSSRLGHPKQLVYSHGKTLLRHAAEAACDSRCDPVIVVLGAKPELMLPELEGLPVQVVRNAEWELGMGTSIHAGLRELETSRTDLDAVVLVVCDQPALSKRIINDLVTASEQPRVTLVASEYSGTLGVPALFGRDLFPELLALAPEQGAKPVIMRHKADAIRVPFPEGALDIDRPEDLAKIAPMLP